MNINWTTLRAKLDKLDAVLAQTSTSPQDAALFAEMLSPPNDGSLPPKASNSSKRSPPAGAAPSLCSIAPVPHGASRINSARSPMPAKRPRSIRPHRSTQRHTYASLMVMDSVPLMVVARNLEHADTRMVEKHYGHLATSYVREAIRAAKPLGIGEAAKIIPLAGTR
jgi:hypothetical protein